MGIDLDIKNTCKSWAVHSFMQKRQMREALGSGYVKIEDCLTRLFFGLGPRRDGFVSTVELYEMFLHPIKRAFAYEEARVYVALLDDEKNKSSRKNKTHEKRDGAKKSQSPEVLPYSKHCRLVPDGVLDDETHTTSLIDLQRFRITRGLRPMLWQLFVEWVQTETFFDEGHLLVLEVSKDGPLLLPSSANAWPSDVPRPVSLAHDHSESDPSCAHWARVFRQRKVVIVSVDTDIIPVCVLSVGALTDAAERNPRLLWSFKENSSDDEEKNVVDVHVLTDSVTAATGLSAEQFAMFCILSGTDYVSKGLWAHGFGCLTVLYTLRMMKSELQQIIDIAKSVKYAATFEESVVQRAVTPFQRIVRKLYENGRKREYAQHMMTLLPTRHPFSPKGPKTFSQVLVNTKSSQAKRKLFGKENQPPSEEEKEEETKRLKTDNDTEVTLAPLMSMSTIIEKYKASKSFKIPTEDTMKQVVDDVMWNFLFWRHSAVPSIRYSD